jgi:hypothetical protein
LGSKLEIDRPQGLIKGAARAQFEAGDVIEIGPHAHVSHGTSADLNCWLKPKRTSAATPVALALEKRLSDRQRKHGERWPGRLLLAFASRPLLSCA